MMKRALFWVFVLTALSCKSNQLDQVVLVWDRYLPYNADPLEYDDSIHHLSFRSVLAPLVTQYRQGSFTGILAESWVVKNDYSIWHFRIRKGMKFENGDEITSRIIQQSLRRVAYLLKQNKSNAGFAEWLDGFSQLDSPVTEIPGIAIENDGSVILRFVKPMPRLLEMISFGLYSIVHPGDYDGSTGKWKDPRKVTASGPYRVESWTDQKFGLRLRDDFPTEIRHQKPLKKLEFTSLPELRSKADVVYSFSIDTPPGQNYRFYSGALSGIFYINCRSWRHKNSPCHTKEERVRLRNEFYRAMMDMNTMPVYSFFPTIMKGIRELTPSLEIHPALINKKIIKYRIINRDSHWIPVYHQSVEKAGKVLGYDVSATEVEQTLSMHEYDPQLNHYAADLYLLPTNILVENPDSDIRFMFQSKEGIQLPDTDGRIAKELEKKELDPQKINEILWDQGVIWPLTHYSQGVWAKEGIDFSLVNLILPPTDFSWVGWK